MLRCALLLAVLVTGTPLAGAELAVPAEPGALAHAIQSARAGDILLLARGDHEGPLVIDRPLTLSGQAGARIVGPGAGSVITVTAGDVTIQGLAITGSGKRLNDLDSGIVIARSAENVRIIANSIEGNLIGVDVQGGRNAVIRANRIQGREDLRMSERGPGIYVWNAPGLAVEDNDISHGRDGVFITTSHHAVYRNNRFSELRFAFHSMYANDIEVAGNISRGNGMGFAFMYSRDLTVRANLSEGDRTHGFFMNFANGAILDGNAVRGGGEKCLFIYNSNNNRITANHFEGCGIGIHFTAGSQGNIVAGNAFVSNRTQVKYVGTRWVEWSHEGRGNYWSDHVSFDIDANGIADSPYRPNDMIDQLVWRQPMARLLLGAPAIQLIRWSQSRFPGLLPGGVVDNFPLADGTDAARAIPQTLPQTGPGRTP